MFAPSLALSVLTALIAASVALRADVPAWGIIAIYGAVGTGTFLGLLWLSYLLSALRNRARSKRISTVDAKLRWRS